MSKRIHAGRCKPNRVGSRWRRTVHKSPTAANSGRMPWSHTGCICMLTDCTSLPAVDCEAKIARSKTPNQAHGNRRECNFAQFRRGFSCRLCQRRWRLEFGQQISGRSDGTNNRLTDSSICICNRSSLCMRPSELIGAVCLGTLGTIGRTI